MKPQTEAIPRIDRGILVVGSRLGAIVALQASDGSILWKMSLYEHLNCLIGHDALLYVGSSTRFDRARTEHPWSIAALRAHDSSLVWQWVDTYFADRISLAADGDIVFIEEPAAEKTVYAVDAQTGKVRWENQLDITPNSAIPVGRILAARAGCVFLREIGPRGNFSVYALATGARLWQMPRSSGFLLFSEAGSLVEIRGEFGTEATILQTNDGSHVATMPISPTDNPLALSDDGSLYVMRPLPDELGQLVAIDVFHGQELWRTNILGRLPVLLPSQFLITEKTLYYANRHRLPGSEEVDAEVGALDVQTGEPYWFSHVELPLPGRRQHLTNAISIAKGPDSIYMTTTQGVYAFSADNGALKWWELVHLDLMGIPPIYFPRE